MFEDADNNAIAELSAWKNKPAKHQPDYDDPEELAGVIAHLRKLPPLVFAGEADELKEQIARAQKGQAFVLFGGDCAESFEKTTAERIRAKVRTILQMSAILTYGASVPVVKIGRMAGQYSKPRSNPMETRGDVTLPSYLGDSINGYDFTPESRRHDPQRLIESYLYSVATLNLMRAFTKGGFADLSEVHSWNKGFMANPAYEKYETVAKEIDRAMRFMEAAGVDMKQRDLTETDLYSSHEALVLPFEHAMTRIDSRTKQPYMTSAHFLWIGERTRGLDEAHVELLSHVRNPIGVKLGPEATPEDAIALIDALNPEGEPGRLTFITRMGAANIVERMPRVVEAVRADGRPVTWVSDPMHGNTITASNGIKTRRFDDIMTEIRGFFAVHEKLGTHPGGIHLEMTGDDVTEILGGSEEIVEETLGDNYESLVDPRLNHQQSLEVAFQVADMLRDVRL
ncbi:class II 3-deoxy-7-phosphoheptulonate synthase [Actinobaculum suis]|uniref:class II 3-deoxy-7-phosphoheptulonate synthase n=1 Tax=Actinobaculum suis TaxID=1657 RepID=UPI00066FD33F|nr:3-deoxy-7-phosphoheptulonate synthase class II [Actinobaculum suis]KMY22874.1 phospho-2-dehydro-3-deoxyheptonate aldolase [Actinobaculum suis]OCA93918.1 3-deoxy-7-phosphoheptulonate synthase [Actinobaculum suis]OCA94474.1 3-deoxy-7-phosphoheptulonate synthase [Actinobaculum suis]